MNKEDLPTPALLIDLEALEANIEKMSQHAKVHLIGLRPHVKTHKCPEIARRQIVAGALGICCATIREAEAMATAGISGLLITSEMVGRNRIERLVALTRQQPDTMSVVDNLLHVEQLNTAAEAAGVKLNVLIDIDPNGHRTGVQAGADTIQLAEKIDRLPHLNLRGLQCYSGRSSHIVGFEERRKHSEAAMTPALETLQVIRQKGLPVEIMSGGSTGTYNIDTALTGMTELQTGSYVFMDVDYRSIGGASGAIYDDFANALFVRTMVISANHAGMVTIDAGIKAFATDQPHLPEIRGIEGVIYHFAGDEHGMLDVREASREIRLGEALEFIVPHCDPNVNLFDKAYVVRGEEVVDVWNIARGY
jgi:D-serine deaminase-like pyridoxal phosphate-dependent protein